MSNNKELFNQSLGHHLNMKKKKDALKRALINAGILSIFLYDLSFKKFCPGDIVYWIYIKMLMAVIFGTSLLFYSITYIYYYFSSDALQGTSDQRKLLNIDEKSFVVEKPKVDNKNNSKNETFNISSQLTQSWFNTSANMSNQSINVSLPLNASEVTASYLSSANNSFQTPHKFTAKNEPISDETGLSSYLNEIARQEKNLSRAIETQNNISGFNASNSFWNVSSGGKLGMLDDISMMLKTTLYQLSPIHNKQPSKDELVFSSSKSITPTEEDIKKISSAKLSNYVANLRMWMSSTILDRLIGEINKIDQAFQQRNMGDFKIGHVGLERLKKTSENHQLVQIVPQLPMLTPFLDLTNNQEYLVNRIKELAKGSCLANYKSVGGSVDEHTPTDSAIIFHLFCAYMDSQLWRSPDCGRPFFDRYVLVINDIKKSSKEIINMVSNKSKCAILCVNPMKPRFNFISGEKIHSSSHDRNNLFYVIIQFLIYLKENCNGNIDGVNLGKSGINILCVVEN